jgi:hypothetical protein
MRYPNTARIWNYQLGGKDNYAIDRKASEAANAMVRALGVPDGAETAIESRHLLQRMVDYMLSQGVRQFLDLGSGLPNMANTHQIAHRAAADARIVYVDIDPLVSTYAAALMAGPNVVTLRADLRQPEQVLSNTRVRDLFDFGQPVGIMLMCVLHCLWDKAAHRRSRGRLAPVRGRHQGPDLNNPSPAAQSAANGPLARPRLRPGGPGRGHPAGRQSRDPPRVLTGLERVRHGCAGSGGSSLWLEGGAWRVPVSPGCW